LLDRGQIDDRFGSTFICWMFAVAVTCLATAVWWELRQPDPIIHLHLLGTRNFAISCSLYFLFGLRFADFDPKRLAPMGASFCLEQEID
jgi:DHA2 family multidrug resistance protein